MVPSPRTTARSHIAAPARPRNSGGAVVISVARRGGAAAPRRAIAHKAGQITATALRLALALLLLDAERS
jgi:hypothetical protein